VGSLGSTWWIETSTGVAPPGAAVLPLDGSVAPLVIRGGTLSLAEGGGARWSFERDYQNQVDQYRLERFGEDAQQTVEDNPVPTDGQPAGALAVGDGGVWVPLRDGVARMDTGTGRLVALLPLPFDEARSVAVDGSVIVVTDNNAVRTIDPASNAVSAPHEIISAAQGTIGGLADVNGTIWVQVERDSTSTSLLRLDPSFRATAELRLPFESSDSGVGSANGRLWLVGPLRIGVPETAAATDTVVVLIDSSAASVSRTVVVHGYASGVAWASPTELLLAGFERSVSGGGIIPSLYKIAIDSSASS
jgi:hypothetical protein